MPVRGGCSRSRGPQQSRSSAVENRDRSGPMKYWIVRQVIACLRQQKGQTSLTMKRPSQKPCRQAMGTRNGGLPIDGRAGREDRLAEAAAHPLLVAFEHRGELEALALHAADVEGGTADIVDADLLVDPRPVRLERLGVLLGGDPGEIGEQGLVEGARLLRLLHRQLRRWR